MYLLYRYSRVYLRSEDPNESGFDTIKGLLSDFASMRGEFSIKDETPTGLVCARR